MSTDDRRVGPVAGEPGSVREAPTRKAAAPKRNNLTVDPREETVTKRVPPRTTKRRSVIDTDASVKPTLQSQFDVDPGTDTAVGSVGVLTPAHLPPIQLQPDPPESVENPTMWVPTVFAPQAPEPAPVEPAVLDPGVLDPGALDPGVLETGLLETGVVDPTVMAPLGDAVAEAPTVGGAHQQTRLTNTGRRPRRRVRRVTRVVRHVDPWSVFKVALVFSAVLYGICLTAGVLLWNVAYTTGTIDNLQKFFESFGWSSFRFKGGQLFHNAWIAGLFGSLGLTGLALLATTLFNLIADLVGGIRVTVLEEEVVERTPSAPKSWLRVSTSRSAIQKGSSPAVDSVDSPDSVEQPG